MFAGSVFAGFCRDLVELFSRVCFCGERDWGMFFFSGVRLRYLCVFFVLMGVRCQWVLLIREVWSEFFLLFLLLVF